MSQYNSPSYSPHGQPQVVHIIARPGGIWRAVSIVLGLFLFCFVFGVGLIMGIGIMGAAGSLDTVMLTETYRDGNARNSTIAIIPIDGVIDDSKAEFVRDAVDYVLDDANIRAVILRVDSPGGGVTASDQIWYEVNRLKNSGRPVIASYGGVAASGGYYVSCAADYIMAEETCITGSIGVIAQVLTLEGLMDKIGVQPVTLVATGSPEKSVANDIFRSWNDHDRAKITQMLDAAYSVFHKRVQDGRSATLSDESMLNAVANGSIYTATEAKENGLIDGVGYLDDAIGVAETQAKITTGRAKVVLVRHPPSLADALFGVEARAGSRSLAGAGSLNADSIRGLVNDLAVPRVMYLMH